VEPVNSGLSSTDIYNIAKALRIRSITTVALCEHGDRASTCYMGAYFKPLGPIAYSGKLDNSGNINNLKEALVCIGLVTRPGTKLAFPKKLGDFAQ